jgi:hypothetical protein
LAITQSVAFFFDPDPDAMIECLPSRTAPGQQPKYASILAAH